MSAIPNIPMKPELAALIERARQHKMTPAEHKAQLRSFILAEAAFGSDADEAEYNAAHARGDMERCAALEAEHTKAEEVVTELFHFWVNHPEELPESYIAEIPGEGLARVVADYIAGMTDNFILLQFAETRRNIRAGMGHLWPRR